ncbi:MAG: glutathione binding-like protein, partial [Thiothrix litoralis]
LEQCQAEGKAGLAVLEQQLAGSDWLANDRPTIADIACYPYVMLAPAGEISLEDYPHVQQWLARVEALPGWVPMTA